MNQLDPNIINRLPFSREEDLRLWEGYKKFGKKWVEISMKSFQSTRPENQIKTRWYSAAFKKFISNSFGHDAYSGCKASKGENKLGVAYVEAKPNIDHTTFGCHFSREEDLCLWEGYKKFVDHTTFGCRFSWEEDLCLWEGYKKFGKKWVEISMKAFHSTRSENQIKSRWYSASFKKFVSSNKFGPDAYSGCKASLNEERRKRDEDKKAAMIAAMAVERKRKQKHEQEERRKRDEDKKAAIAARTVKQKGKREHEQEERRKQEHGQEKRRNETQRHSCVEGIVKENQKGKTLYSREGIMKLVQDAFSKMNVTDVNRVIVYADACGVFGHSSDQMVRNSGQKCFILDKIQPISKHETYRIDRIQSGADCDHNLGVKFHSPIIHSNCKIESNGQSIMNNFIIIIFFSNENGFGSTVGTESSSLHGRPFGVGISDLNADIQKATVRKSQAATLQELNTSAGIEETKVALYNNFLQVKSNAIIAYHNLFKMQADNTLIEASRWSEDSNRRYVSASDKNERLIKLNPNSEIESQLQYVNTNHEELKNTLPIKNWKHNYGTTPIYFKRRGRFLDLLLSEIKVNGYCMCWGP